MRYFPYAYVNILVGIVGALLQIIGALFKLKVCNLTKIQLLELIIIRL
jgi:hypothetical protein